MFYKFYLGVNLLEKQNVSPEVIYNTVFDWETYIIFALLGIFVFIYFQYNKIMQISILPVSINQTTNKGKYQNQQDADIPRYITLVVLFIFIVLIAFVLLYLYKPLPQNFYMSFLLYSTIFFSIIVFIILKSFIKSLLAYVFLLSPLMKEIEKSLFYFYKSCVIIIFPFVILVIYSNWSKIFLFISFLILLVLYVMQIIKSIVQISNSIKFSKLYLILYLCTVEILPYGLIIKYVLNNGV